MSGGGAGNASSVWGRAILEQLLGGAHLDRPTSRDWVGGVMDGDFSEPEIAAVLIALRMKGETAEELIGAAEAMRARSTTVSADRDALVDTCGTGGDGAGTFNISTAAAIVAAATGVRVAKHGNRSVSSRCGSADVLEALGIELELGPRGVVRCLEKASIGFMFAPRFHPAMRHAAPVRRALGVRTVFNLLGPLTNPAGARRQVVGAYAPEVARLLADALLGLGCEHGWVVHGAGGLDELSLLGDNIVFEVTPAGVEERTIGEADHGLPVAAGMPAGGDAADNAALMRRVLEGESGSLLDSVLLNAAAALVVAGRALVIGEAVEECRAAVCSGAAEACLERWRVVAAQARTLELQESDGG